MKNRIPIFQVLCFLTLTSAFCYGQGDVVKIQTLLAKAKNAPPYQCELVMSSFMVGKTQPKPSLSPSMIWRKGPYSKIDMGFGSVTIVGPDGAYDYDAGKDRYTKHPGSVGPPITESDQFIKAKNWKITILRDDVVDGKSCIVVRPAEIKTPRPDFSIWAKYWIWKENGLIIKIEETTKTGPVILKMKILAKNFKFADIPDSIFSVPKRK